MKRAGFVVVALVTVASLLDAGVVAADGVLYVFNVPGGVGLAGWARSADTSYAGLIAETAARYNVPATLIAAVIRAESNFNPRAVSPKGASGLMQLMPATAAQLGVQDVLDPRENVDGGVRYLRDLLRQYRGNVRLAIAAYNAGPDVVDRLRDVPPYRETQTYVARVLRLFDSRLLLAGDRAPSVQPPRITPPQQATVPAVRSTLQRASRYVAAAGTLIYTNLPNQSLPLAARGRVARAPDSGTAVVLSNRE